MAEPEQTTAAPPEGTETPAVEGNPIEERLSSFMDEVRGEIGGLKDTLTAPPEDDYGYDPAYGPPQQTPYPPQDPYQQQVPPGHVVLYDENDNPVVLPAQQAQQYMQQQPGVSQQPYGQPDPNQLQQLAPQLAEMLGITDLQQAVERREMLDRVATYEQQYPDLTREEVYKPAAEAAARKAEEMGRPDLAADPDFVVMHWLAGRAAESATAGTPADGAPGIQLEAGGGATPEAEQPDPAQQIVDAMRGKNPFAS